MNKAPKALRTAGRMTGLAIPLATLSLGAVVAEDAPAATQSTATAGQVAGSGAGMSTADQMAQAQSIVGRAGDLSQRVGHMLDEATREGDIIRVTCLNEKLTQINANLHNAQSRLSVLQGTVDSGERNHEFTVLMVLAQKFQVLDQEANQCVGQDLYQTGSTKIVTEINNSLLPATNADPSTPPTLLPPGAGGIPDTTPPDSGMK